MSGNAGKEKGATTKKRALKGSTGTAKEEGTAKEDAGKEEEEGEGGAGPAKKKKKATKKTPGSPVIGAEDEDNPEEEVWDPLADEADEEH